MIKITWKPQKHRFLFFVFFWFFFNFSSKWCNAVYNFQLPETSNEFSRAFQCIHGIDKVSKKCRKIPEFKSNGWILILKSFCLKNERFYRDQVSSQIHVLQNSILAVNRQPRSPPGGLVELLRFLKFNLRPCESRKFNEL